MVRLGSPPCRAQWLEKSLLFIYSSSSALALHARANTLGLGCREVVCCLPHVSWGEAKRGYGVVGVPSCWEPSDPFHLSGWLIIPPRDPRQPAGWTIKREKSLCILQRRQYKNHSTPKKSWREIPWLHWVLTRMPSCC